MAEWGSGLPLLQHLHVKHREGAEFIPGAFLSHLSPLHLWELPGLLPQPPTNLGPETAKTCSQFWRPRVQTCRMGLTAGAGRAMISPVALGDVGPQSSGGCQHLLAWGRIVAMSRVLLAFAPPSAVWGPICPPLTRTQAHAGHPEPPSSEGHELDPVCTSLWPCEGLFPGLGIRMCVSLGDHFSAPHAISGHGSCTTWLQNRSPQDNCPSTDWYPTEGILPHPHDPPAFLSNFNKILK